MIMISHILIPHFKELEEALNPEQIDADTIQELEEILREIKPEAMGELRRRIDEVSGLSRLRKIRQARVKTEMGEKPVELKFIPAKTSLDYFYGYFGENCASENPEELLNSAFTPIRIVHEGKIVGCVHTLTLELDGRKSLVICGVEPQTPLASRLDVEAFVKGLFDKLVKEVIIPEGYEQLLITTTDATQSNRPRIKEVMKSLIVGKEDIAQRQQLTFPQNTSYSITNLKLWNRVKSPVARGPFNSLLMMFGLSPIIVMVWAAVTRGASHFDVQQVVDEVTRGDIVGAGVSMLQAAGIGIGLIAGGIAIKYGVKALKAWDERSTITKGAKGEITFRDAGEIKDELVEIVKKELPVVGTQVNERAGKVVEELLKGVISISEVSKIERQALIKAVTTVEIGTLRGRPVNFGQMVLGEVPGRENIQRALLEERGPTLEELLRELLRNRPDYMREVVYFYQGVLIPEGATLSESQKKFLRQSLVLRTLKVLHDIAPPEARVELNVAAEALAGQIENLREKYGVVLLEQLTSQEKMKKLQEAVWNEIEARKVKFPVKPIFEALRENKLEKLTPAQKGIVLNGIMRAKIWNHESSLWQVLEQIFGVVPGQTRIRGEEIRFTCLPQVKYEEKEEEIAEEREQKVFMKSRAMVRVRDTGRAKWHVEVILNGGYNTLSGLFYRALHELVYAMILNVQGRLPAEGQVNRELAGLINYYLTSGGILERLDKGIEYTLSQEMIRLIKEVPEQGLTEGIIPYLVRAMPALDDRASEISNYERIAKYAPRAEIVDIEGTKVLVFDICSLFGVEVRFGRINVKPRNREVFNVMGNIVNLAEKQGKGDKIKFAFVSDVRGLSKEVMEQMLNDYMLDYGLSPVVVRQIIGNKKLILDRRALKLSGKEPINTRYVYDMVVRALAVGGIEVTILTDNKDRWKRKTMKEVLWVILDKPREGEMLSTATGLVVAVEGGISSWLEAFIRENWSNEEAEKLLRMLEKGKPFSVPARPVSRTYLERMEMERKIYRIEA